MADKHAHDGTVPAGFIGRPITLYEPGQRIVCRSKWLAGKHGVVLWRKGMRMRVRTDDGFEFSAVPRDICLERTSGCSLTEEQREDSPTNKSCLDH